jgi:hypothetical protein
MLIASVLLALSLVGCASGYKQFYRASASPTQEELVSFRVAPPPAVPIVERAQPGNAQMILDAYAKRGYVMIGNSMFNTGRAESDAAAVGQAQAVGADLVLILNPKYTGSVTTSIPITTPTTSTSYSSGSATAYGAGGPVTAYGTGTTTTYGSTTTYIPMTINRSDYGAVYFVKMKFNLGIFPRDLNDSERQEMQTNKGAVVRLVVDGTPAFDADVLVGDAVVALDGLPVPGGAALNSMLKERRGKLIALTLVRHGQRIEKIIQLNP